VVCLRFKGCNLSTNRQAQFERSQEARFPQGEPSLSPRVPPSVARTAGLEDRAGQQAKARSAEFVGNDSSFVRYGQLVPVRFPAIGVPVSILTFQVPPGRILAVNSVQWWLSEPFAYINNQFGWRLTLNGGQMPHHDSVNTQDTTYFPLPLPGADSRTPMFPVYIPEGATVDVEFNEVQQIPVGPTAFESYLAATCWLFGELMKPGGGA